MNETWRGRRPPLGAAWMFAWWVGTHAVTAQAEDSRQCWANCLPSKECTLSDAGKLSADPKLKLGSNRLLLVPRCFERMVVEGEVVVRYLQGRRLFVVPKPLSKPQSVAELLTTHPPDQCSVPDPVCLQKAMQGLKAATGGHGIDGQASLPAGQGEPCSLGLPCGTVMAPAAVWEFRLNDERIDGSWQTTVLRGQAPSGLPARAEAGVSAGVVRADGSQFAPGVTYAYVLRNRDGSVRASGEFNVQSSSQQAALRRLVDRRIAAGLPEEVAWVDALAANQLDWDAIQRVKP